MSPPPGNLPPPPLPGGPETLEDRLSRFGLRGQGPLKADVGHEFVDAIRVTVSTSPSSDKAFSPDLYLQLVLKDLSGFGSLLGSLKGVSLHNTVLLQLNMQYYKREFEFPEFTRVEKFHPQLEPNHTDEFSIDVSGHTRGRVWRSSTACPPSTWTRPGRP